MCRRTETEWTNSTFPSFHFSHPSRSDMRGSALLLLLLRLMIGGWGLFVSVSGSPAVEGAYGAVVDLVSPGQQHLSADSLRSIFNRLENRVQCGEVSCGKVSFIRADPGRHRRELTDGRSR